MKKFALLFVVTVLIISALACTIGTPAPTPTPQPTQTPLPTYTPYPTFTPPPTATPIPTATATPKPSVPGIDIPIKYYGQDLTVNRVEFVDSWKTLDGKMQYPSTPGNVLMVVYFDVKGDLNKIQIPLNVTDAEKTFHVRDSNGRVIQWGIVEPTDNKKNFLMIFAVDPNVADYFFTFPNGTEIDLAPFLK